MNTSTEKTMQHRITEHLEAVENGKLEALRDQFSMCALSGLLAAESSDYQYEDLHVAGRAYSLADAMLKELAL